jgi:CheY-like chemotaxis protein
MLAHELRNPLAAISTALAVFQKPEVDAQVALGARNVISRQLLSRMVDDLLDVARVSSGKIDLHRQTVDVAELVARCVATIAARARREQHTINVQTKPAWADADPIRLEQVIVNLLTNAAKYTPQGGTISVSVEGTSGEVRIVVSDTGVGMTADLLERIFDLFVQGEQSLARTQGGLGIGLTLVKRLVELHGGSIQAGSDGPNRGSRFTIRLPRAASPLSEQAAIRRTGTTTAGGHRIVVVEDNPDVRDMLTVYLEIDGHRVYQAADGPSGFDVAIEAEPDVALIDIGLPGMDGCELAQRLRAHEATAHTTLIAITGYGRAEDRKRIEDAGFHVHLIKPVEEERLRQIILAVPRRQRA